MMDEQLQEIREINTKVDRIEQEVHVIASNHIPHLYSRMGAVEKSVDNIRGTVKTWNWKMWSAVISAIASIVGIFLTFIGMLIGA